MCLLNELMETDRSQLWGLQLGAPRIPLCFCRARMRVSPEPGISHSFCPSCPCWHRGASWLCPRRGLCPMRELCPKSRVGAQGGEDGILEAGLRTPWSSAKKAAVTLGRFAECVNAKSSPTGWASVLRVSNRSESKAGDLGASLVAQWLRIACQCRGHGFEPWSGKIPHVAEQLSPCATTTEPAL